MRARPRGNLIHYYLDTGGKPRKEIPLGSDYALAVKKWGELAVQPRPEGVQPASEGTFAAVVQAYWKDIIPTKEPRTRRDNEKERVWILRFFNTPPAPIDKIEPQHIQQYLNWRVKEAVKAAEARNAARVKAGRASVPIPPKYGQVRANREKALISHIWNYARSTGKTKLPNPCAGIKGFRETGRDVYVDDELFERVKQHADKPLEFAMRLADTTGQRPADVLGMSEEHIRGQYLGVKQGKTKAKLRIMVENDLETLIEEIRAYKAGLPKQAPPLLVNERGNPLTAAMLRKRFDKARKAAGIDIATFQFRDLRAKAATDADDSTGIKDAQSLLGHATEEMTAKYIRHKLGKKVRIGTSKKESE
ncbi:tyrosine-type recombinase/integrase [Variovorax paradoxus]|uniref:tyrosine-type recombinase/integrase n=1 Tax=Variovorax paradoxus TaxID=34073 RepID=UPI0027D80C83|nr:tyrosine-type recombinase/integrase [Variovorax paradoxus]